LGTILVSPGVLDPVIRSLKLNTTPAKLQETLEVKEITSQVLRVSVKDQDPGRASAIVNGIVDTFVRFYGDLRSGEVKKQIEQLEGERQAADRDLRMASSRLERFKRGNGISSLADQTREALEQARLSEEERNKAEAEYREVSARVANAEDQLSRMPETKEIREEATQTALLDRLRLDVSDLKSQLAKALAVYTEEHPTVKRLQEQLQKAETRLDEESRKRQTSVRIVANPDREALLGRLRELRNQRDGLAARVSRLNASLARIQSQAASYSGKDVEQSLLTQQYTLAEQRLGAVSARLGHVRNAAMMLAGGRPIAIVDKAGPHNPPFDLSQGRTLRLTALAFIMSLAMCIAVAIALESADRRIRSVEDVEQLTQLPVVSVVPRLPGGARQNALCLTTENDPASHLAESYHFLANHILRQTLHRDNTVLMGATARPGQGATTAMSNLAVALARTGRQVVMVEADLRRPFLHQVFDTEPKPGLTDVLQGRLPVRDALSDTQVDNLRLLAAGSIVKDPWSLLWQPSMSTTVHDLRELADYVIFNVPSATVFADALCVAPHVDGAVIVMRTSEMPNGAEHKVQQWLDEVGVPVMGVVLNGVPAKDMETFEFHRSYTARRADDPRPALTPPTTAPVRRSA
ncbi:MAG TPA: polysaccharide biosynthesis tyrosine autokinase, partial [Armatimonadota bacterium]|nr:polysaccharide biosynthesis tyrosine autokinase [Armatimonadota bacterium]